MAVSFEYGLIVVLGQGGEMGKGAFDYRLLE